MWEGLEGVEKREAVVLMYYMRDEQIKKEKILLFYFFNKMYRLKNF